jgi:cell division protein FtsW
MQSIKIWWRTIDQISFSLAIILMAFSMLLITTASYAVAGRIGVADTYFSSRQIIYIVFGIVLLCTFSSFNKHQIKKIAFYCFSINVILLILVKFIGYEAKGATRWINIFGFSMQPSEFIKPFFSIIIASILSEKMADKSFPGFTISFVLYGIIGTLLIMQPDLGMLVTLTLIYCVQLFIGGIGLIWIITSVILSFFGLIAAYYSLPHVQKRINLFFDPENNENYQVSKSLLAFENGGIYGKGPGEGTIKQVLPDSHTDFIFAVAGEELGSIVCIFICSIFMFLIIRGFVNLLKQEDPFVIFASAGILSQIAMQSIINMGVSLNLFPTKGMTLPFISYGGSSTIAISIGFGMYLGLIKNIADVSKFKTVKYFIKK